MVISLPKEPVYYYECSNAEFRLVYFIPRDYLERLEERGKISKQALKDFPDGVDLDCTESDFKQFQKIYGYRPQLAPDTLRRTFFAILSSTRDWKNYRGSGFIPEADIERYAKEVEESLKREQSKLEDIQPLPGHPILEERRERRYQQANQQSRMYRYLEEMKMDGINPEQTLRHQRFSPIEMGEGENAAEVFSDLLQKRKKQ